LASSKVLHTSNYLTQGSLPTTTTTTNVSSPLELSSLQNELKLVENSCQKIAEELIMIMKR
jgi:hypothetical protein